MRLLLLFIFFLITLFSWGQTNYQLLYSFEKTNNFIPAEGIVTLHKSIMFGESKLFPSKVWKENTVLKKIAGVSYRAAKLTLIDYPVVNLLGVYAHEKFGHARIARSYGFEVTEVFIDLPIPYGKGGGFTKISFGNKAPSILQETHFTTSGIEIQRTIANSVKNKWVAEGEISHDNALLYLFGQNGTLAYLIAGNPDLSGNDISNYADLILEKYPQSGYTRKKTELRGGVLLSLNTLSWVSFYSLLMNYLLKGNSHTVIPFIKFGSIKYLPSINYELTPYGDEFQLENFFKYKNSSGTITLAKGDTRTEDAYRLSVESFNLINSKRISIGADIHFWKQKKFGGMLKLKSEFSLAKQLNVVLNSGFKSEGFLNSYGVDKNVIFEFGLSFNRFKRDQK